MKFFKSTVFYHWFCKQFFREKTLPEKIYARFRGKDSGIVDFHDSEDFEKLDLGHGDVIGVYHLQNSKTAHIVIK